MFLFKKKGKKKEIKKEKEKSITMISNPQIKRKVRPLPKTPSGNQISFAMKLSNSEVNLFILNNPGYNFPYATIAQQ